jgi:aspartate racemase
MNPETRNLTVGVLGGMGPYATLAFFKCILDNTPAQKDWDHLRVVIDNNPRIPSRTRAFLYGEADPVPMMVKSTNALRDAGADFVVLPCNSAHYFLPRLLKEVDIPFIDMIEQTCSNIVALHVKKVGLLAGEVTVKARLYEQRLEEHGINVLQVPDEEQPLVRSVIEDVKQNVITNVTHMNIQSLVSGLERRGAEAVILGCTELPMAIESVTTDC